MNEEWNDQNTEKQEGEEKVGEERERIVASVEYGPASEKASRRRERGGVARTIALSLSLVFLLLAFFAFGGILLGKWDGNVPNGNGTPNAGTPTAPDGGNSLIMQETDGVAGITEGDVSSVVAACADSVVEIITTTERYTGGNVQSGAGSGVIVGTDSSGTGSYIVTNNHVIEGDVSSIIVRTTAGEEFSADVVGTDWVSDLALLRIEKTGLTVAIWGDSADLRLGQSIIAIGNPLGSLGGSVSSGIISGVERTITIEGVPMKLLQIDAAINPGNSGGGLFDMRGNLVGIVNAKSVATSSGTTVEGIGFAIPADYAKSIVTELFAKGYVDGRVDLGLSFGSATNYGLLITASPTDEIVAGEYLYAIRKADGTTFQITSTQAYRTALLSLTAGETVELTLVQLKSSGFFVATETRQVSLVVQSVQK